jgi:hypothetical protein
MISTGRSPRSNVSFARSLALIRVGLLVSVPGLDRQRRPARKGWLAG